MDGSLTTAQSEVLSTVTSLLPIAYGQLGGKVLWFDTADNPEVDSIVTEVEAAVGSSPHSGFVTIHGTKKPTDFVSLDSLFEYGRLIVSAIKQAVDANSSLQRQVGGALLVVRLLPDSALNQDLFNLAKKHNTPIFQQSPQNLITPPIVRDNQFLEDDMRYHRESQEVELRQASLPAHEELGNLTDEQLVGQQLKQLERWKDLDQQWQQWVDSEVKPVLAEADRRMLHETANDELLEVRQKLRDAAFGYREILHTVEASTLIGIHASTLRKHSQEGRVGRYRDGVHVFSSREVALGLELPTKPMGPKK